MLPRVHHWSVLSRAQVSLELSVRRAIVCLEAVVKNDVAVPSCAVWDIIKSCGFLSRRNFRSRLILEVVKVVTRLAALVVTELVKTTIGKDDIAVTPRAISSVSHVFLVVSPVNRGGVHA